MKLPALLAISLAVLCRPAPCAEAPEGKEDKHQLFTEANRLFNAARSQEDLRHAVENYRALLSRGIRNGKLHYNLGCALLRLRETGPAILNLRRALLYLPGDPKASSTLDFARNQVPDEFPRVGEKKVLRTVFFWHFAIPFEARLWIAILSGGLFWAFLAVRIFVRLPFHRTLLGALLVLAISTGCSLAAEVLGQPGEDAVIVVPEAEVRSGNGTGFELVFSRPIRSGAEVRVLEVRGNWSQLEFPNGVRGWTLSSAVETVREEIR